MAATQGQVGTKDVRQTPAPVLGVDSRVSYSHGSLRRTAPDACALAQNLIS